MSRFTRLSGVAAVAILIVAVAMAGMALAGPPLGVDSETVNTTSTSDITAGANITAFNANASNVTSLEGKFGSTNASMEIIDPDSGRVVASNSSDVMNQSFSDAANETYHYQWNLTHDELETLDIGAGVNKSMTLKLINDTNAATPNTTSVTFYIESTDDRAVIYAGDDAAAGSVTGLEVVNEADGGFWGVTSTDNSTTVTDDGTTIGNDTTLYVVMANTSGADVFGDAQEQKLFGSYEDGDFIRYHQVLVEGHQHAVFLDDSPSEVADGATYAETTTLGGEDAYAVHVGDEYDAGTSVSVEAAANDPYPRWDAYGLEADALGTSRLSAIAGLLAG